MSYIEKFWRDATAADVTRVMAGGKVEARFRDHESKPWDEGEYLGGWLEGRWKKAGLGSWNYCQVYAPHQWFLDKPEPGEGFRLLRKKPDEALQPGDEAFNLRFDGKWEPSLNVWAGYGQNESTWYRRRIEQPKPEPKYKVGQRVKIVGGISGPYIGKLAIIEAMTIETTGWFYELRYVEGSFHEPNLEPVEPKHYTLQVGDTISTPSGRQAIVTEHGVEVT